MTPRLIMLIGPPGVGKKEIAQYIMEIEPDSTFIDYEQIQQRKYSDQESRLRAYLYQLNLALKDEYSIVMCNGYNLTSAAREYVKEHLNFSCQPEAIWIECNYTTTDDNSSQEEIDGMYRLRESPEKWEDFYNILYIMREPDIGISKRDPYILPTKKALKKFIERGANGSS